jgi:hypothetical protein
MPYSDQVTLGDILGAALAARDDQAEVVAKPERPVPTGLWNIIYGMPSVPKKEWAISEYDITDPKAGQERVRELNKSQIEYYKRWEPDGEYYSELRDGVMHYKVQTNRASSSRLDFDYNTRQYVTIPAAPATYEMLPEDQARTTARLNGQSFYAYYYDKPAEAAMRYSLLKVSVEQDYVAREAARTDNPILLPDELREAVSQYSASFHCANIIPPATISYFRSREDAWDNKRTEMKLGRYLREFAPRLNDQIIGDACAKIGVAYVTDVVLKMARTREEIRNVYVNGPNSCMSGEDNVIGGVHPVECYASDDLAVAYLDRDGDITARTLVNPQRMQYLRIYGDSIRLGTMLQKLGYRESSHALRDAKLLKIKIEDSNYSNHAFLPYLDGNHTQVMDMGDHFKVWAEPERYSGNTSGYIRLNA